MTDSKKKPRGRPPDAGTDPRHAGEHRESDTCHTAEEEAGVATYQGARGRKGLILAPWLVSYVISILVLLAKCPNHISDYAETAASACLARSTFSRILLADFVQTSGLGSWL